MRVGLVLGMWLLAGCLQAAEPVATVRVAFDRDGVTATQVQGMADIAAGRAVSADDPVRIASISKLVTALGVMRMVEAGQLELDADVSRWLGWPLRHPQFPDTPITLRLLLSHRAGLTDAAGYYAVPLGAPLRTVLDDPRAWDTAHAPGTYFRYANIDFPLIADWPNRPRQKIDFETGKPSLTHYRVLERNLSENWTRVDLEPYTGRSHQLRMHLMALGHPILGDPLYADPHTFVRAPRMTLHAAHLDLDHPLTGAKLSFDSPVPF